MTSPQYLEKLAAYVPAPVAEAIYHQPRPLTRPLARRLPAVVLFTDISGFTPLTELLCQGRPQGVEELSTLINHYFTRMIDIVQRYGGEVVKFSGDAMTIIFPAELRSIKQVALPGSEGDYPMQVAARQAGECALAMQAAMHEFADLKTSQGRAFLSMKVGVGAGEILSCSIGGALGRWEYVVGGDPVVQMATAEHLAQPGQIVFSPQAWQHAQKFFKGVVIPQEGNFVEIEALIKALPPLLPKVLDWADLGEANRQTAEQTMLCYIPGAIKARLAQQAEWLAEMRRMTILFIGVGGFDYEAANTTKQLQDLLQATQEIIYRFEGSLGKVAVDDKGTVLLILFGAPPFSHEDDASRAVACALSLQVVAREQNLRMSIGITEGFVFAGPIGSPHRCEYTVIGDEVNLAARLMQYGRGGMTIISERVKDRAGSRFIVDALGELSIRGKAKALPAYQVRGEQGMQDEIVNRYLLQEDHLIGRKRELEQIRRLIHRVHEGRLQLLFMTGELGLGKSRLVGEMVREWIMSGGAAYGGRCVSYGRKIPYQGWREVVAAMFGLNPSLDEEQQRLRLQKGLTELPTPVDQPDYWLKRLPLLVDIIRLQEPNQNSENAFIRNISNELRRDNIFELIEALLRHQAQQYPLLILLEDIHWADELSLSLVSQVCQKLVDSPVLFVLAHRPLPPESETILAKVRQALYAHTLALEPLSEQESLDLIRLTLGNNSLLAQAEELILKRGQGNPFFLQEITRTVLETIKKQDTQSAGALEGLDLPDTLQDVVMSRIDRLSEDEKLTLKIASVIGTSFQRFLLSQVHPMDDATVILPAQLAKLEAENLLKLEAPAPKWEYVFRNVIAQEVVYEGLLLSQRQQLHAIVAETLELIAPSEVEPLAFHYSRSDKWDKAIHYLKQASHMARREYANHAAIGYYGDLLTCMTNKAKEAGESLISTEYWDYLLERARLYNLIGRRDEELEDLGALGIMAEALQDEGRRALAAKHWAYLYETSGDYESGLEVIARAVTLAQAAGDKKLEGEAINQWGKLLYLRGNYALASTHLKQAWEIAHNLQNEVLQARCLHNQGMVALYQADYALAEQHFEAAIDLWKDLGDQVGLGNSLSSLGQVYYETGQHAVSRTYYEQALFLHRAIGDRAGEALVQHNLGQIERSLGNFQQARHLFEQALAFYQSIGDRHHEADSLYHLGFVYGRLKDYKVALTFLEEAVFLLADLDALWWTQVKALIYYGWILHEAGQLDSAQATVMEAMEFERDTELKAGIIEDMALLGRIALSQRQPTVAQLYANQVLNFIKRHGLPGVEHPAMVYLSCYEILKANDKLAQAQEVLQAGQAYLTKQLAQLADEGLKNTYLYNIPENAQLLSLADSGEVSDTTER